MGLKRNCRGAGSACFRNAAIVCCCRAKSLTRRVNATHRSVQVCENGAGLVRKVGVRLDAHHDMRAQGNACRRKQEDRRIACPLALPRLQRYASFAGRFD